MLPANPFCFLYDISANLPDTETEIYAEFTKFAILRLLYRFDCESDLCIESTDDLSPLQRDKYLKICKLAYEMTLLSKQVMQHADVKHFLGQIEEKELFGLITVDKMAMLCGFQKLYTFLHLTFQEFLAASHISLLEAAKQIVLIQKHGKETQMKQVWKFYCGLINKDADCTKKFAISMKQVNHGTLYNIQ